MFRTHLLPLCKLLVTLQIHIFFTIKILQILWKSLFLYVSLHVLLLFCVSASALFMRCFCSVYFYYISFLKILICVLTSIKISTITELWIIFTEMMVKNPTIFNSYSILLFSALVKNCYNQRFFSCAQFIFANNKPSNYKVIIGRISRKTSGGFLLCFKILYLVLWL